MWASALLVSLFWLTVAGAPQAACPADCWCSTEGMLYTARCTSLAFLSKPKHSKQLLQIEALHVTNQSILYGSKLNKLSNLHALDLSYNELHEIPNLSKLSALTRLTLKSNNLRTINTRALPTSLKFLDLAGNDIKNIPEDLLQLDNLVYLNVVKNPLHCTCSSIEIRDVLIERSVRIDEPVVCAAPEKYKRKSWHSIRCDGDSLKKVENIYDRMMGDQSTFSEEGTDELGVHIENSVENDEREESDFIPIHSDKSTNGAGTEAPPSEDEGSGDFSTLGSGDGDVPGLGVTGDPRMTEFSETTAEEPTDEWSGDGESTTPMDEYGNLVPVCLIAPCPTSDDGLTENSTRAGDLADFESDLNSVIEDILGTESSSQIPSSTPAAVVEVVVSTSAPKAKQAPVETINSDVITGSTSADNELEQMTIEEPEAKQSASTYILLFILLLVVAALLIYAVFTKRQAKRKYRQNANARDIEKPPTKDVEMKLLSEPGNDNNKPQNGITEATPLVNGNNENQNGTNGKVQESSPYGGEDDVDEPEPVELRKKELQAGLLTPEAQRVTIKVSELPDSLPKTPILVNRQISTDGRTITTPSYDQRFK